MTPGVLNLRVTRILSRRFGGALFTAVLIDEETGGIADAKEYVVVKASSKLMRGFPMQVGAHVNVCGPVTKDVVAFDGFVRTQLNVDATEISMARPSGEHIVRFLADSAEFVGIGAARARKLWNRFGEDLYTLLDESNAAALEAVLPPEIVPALLAAWSEIGNSNTIRWLQEHDFPLALARKVVRYFGHEARAKVEEDPYRLLSFTATWNETDALARHKLGVSVDDVRRLLAACEEALYRSLAEGHTVLTSVQLKGYVSTILKPMAGLNLRQVIDVAISSYQLNGGFVITGNGDFQSVGTAVIERKVASTLASRIVAGRRPLMPQHQATFVISDYETDEGVQLSPEQKEAVLAASENELLCISGGAGVGKTTVLKAVLALFDAAKVPVTLAALAGRAAKRITEATGREAVTIASLIKHPDLKRLENGALVIDEASMVDTLSMDRIVSALPDSCRIVLVGDGAQLMPVGPGLVFHTLLDHESVSKVTLTVARRFGNEIARVANSIRDGVWPSISNDVGAPTAFMQVLHSESVAERIVELYAEAANDTQVICATRNGAVGTVELNKRIQNVVNSEGPPLHYFDDEHGAICDSGFRLNDIVLCNKNIYEQDLRNGSLGRLVEFAGSTDRRAPESETEGQEQPIGWVEWDDEVRRPVYIGTLLHLTLGYAITIHKAQGSQWRRVLVPVVKARNLDRSMLYTAITRAQNQVIMVGSEEFAREATMQVPHSGKRQVGLGHAINQMIAASKLAAGRGQVDVE